MFMTFEEVSLSLLFGTSNMDWLFQQISNTQINHSYHHGHIMGAIQLRAAPSTCNIGV